MLGQHNQEVLEESGAVSRSKEAVNAPTPAATDKPQRPFDGIRVIDMTVIWAGPYSTMFLGDMGAEVIRVETLQRMPPGRAQFARPDREAEKKRAVSTFPDKDPGDRPWNRSAGFNQHARNKNSISLDLLSPKALRHSASWLR